jgi:hypothetical protein
MNLCPLRWSVLSCHSLDALFFSQAHETATKVRGVGSQTVIKPSLEVPELYLWYQHCLCKSVRYTLKNLEVVSDHSSSCCTAQYKWLLLSGWCAFRMGLSVSSPNNSELWLPSRSHLWTITLHSHAHANLRVLDMWVLDTIAGNVKLFMWAGIAGSWN